MTRTTLWPRATHLPVGRAIRSFTSPFTRTGSISDSIEDQNLRIRSECSREVADGSVTSESTDRRIWKNPARKHLCGWRWPGPCGQVRGLTRSGARARAWFGLCMRVKGGRRAKHEVEMAFAGVHFRI